MGLPSSVGSALVLRIQTTSMQEGATNMRLLAAHKKQKSSILPILAYSNQTKKGYYPEKGRKKKNQKISASRGDVNPNKKTNLTHA